MHRERILAVYDNLTVFVYQFTLVEAIRSIERSLIQYSNLLSLDLKERW